MDWFIIATIFRLIAYFGTDSGPAPIAAPGATEQGVRVPPHCGDELVLKMLRDTVINMTLQLMGAQGNFLMKQGNFDIAFAGPRETTPYNESLGIRSCSAMATISFNFNDPLMSRMFQQMGNQGVAPLDYSVQYAEDGKLVVEPK